MLPSQLDDSPTNVPNPGLQAMETAVRQQRLQIQAEHRQAIKNSIPVLDEVKHNDFFKIAQLPFGSAVMWVALTACMIAGFAGVSGGMAWVRSASARRRAHRLQEVGLLAVDAERRSSAGAYDDGLDTFTRQALAPCIVAGSGCATRCAGDIQERQVQRDLDGVVDSGEEEELLIDRTGVPSLEQPRYRTMNGVYGHLFEACQPDGIGARDMGTSGELRTPLRMNNVFVEDDAYGEDEVAFE